jgi:spermidine synthase
MDSRVSKGACLVFGSGLSALLYQTTWLRELRLIFGNSTAASAAVLGIFMGGLGFGSALLGQRAETSRRPLVFYGRLELLIAVTAALTPSFISMIRVIYITSGGTLAMGAFAGTIVRLVLVGFVLGIPTFLMGGTLPAMARFAVSDRDAGRRGLALLYGTNTLGAVGGAIAGTFFLFERWGNDATLYIACAVNASVAAIALLLARYEKSYKAEGTVWTSETSRETAAPLWLTLVAAAVTGFAFFLMELVWYRMLGPMLGGTAFAFGLILAVALLGIGVGGVIYPLIVRERRPTLNAFACTCAVEALLLTIPFVMGDRLPLAAMLLQPLGALGFFGRVLGWLALCTITVLPTAMVAGVQFPILLGLLGKGRDGVGSQTGAAYAWNTAGAIAGSLAGGFGFIPFFSAPGTWKIVVSLLACCALFTVIVAQHGMSKPLRGLPAIIISTFAVIILLFGAGPTVAWRHGQLDRMKRYSETPNRLRDLLHSLRRDILWQADGVESSIGISKSNSLAFIVNGKCDGNAKADAGTQVMCGLLGALSHPHLKRAAVVGLGTGSTAGWLAAIPSLQRVDVMELEPVIAKFAAECAPVNHHALANPKLNIIFGDARELLLTTRQQYDLIVSEPSNPYRAGVASLFTREYYQTVAKKLNSGGLFAQWLQAYDVDLRTIRIFYATLTSVFPYVETWQTQNGDLLLIGSKNAIAYDIDSLRTRITTEPFRSALANVWQTTDVEGIFSHYVGSAKFARDTMHRLPVGMNTDDRMLLEFAFARNKQSESRLSFADMRRDAYFAGADCPPGRGELDWTRVEEQRIAAFGPSAGVTHPRGSVSDEEKRLVGVLTSYSKDNLSAAWNEWKTLHRQPHNPVELTMVAECLADQGDAAAVPYIEQLETIEPAEAQAVRSRLFWRQHRSDEAIAMTLSFITSLSTDPWPTEALVNRALNLTAELIQANNTSADVEQIYDRLQKPFAVYAEDSTRLAALMRMAVSLDHGQAGEHVLRNIEAAEPNVPWDIDFLKMRSACYSNFHHPLAADAKADLLDYITAESGGLESANPARIDRADQIVSAAR